MRALLVLLLAAAPALAQTPPLILDHDMLTAMARTGAPAVEISYTPTRVVFRTRVRVLLGWIDVQAEAVFVREDKRLHLALQALKAGGLVQNASRFFEASKAREARQRRDRGAARRDLQGRQGRVRPGGPVNSLDHVPGESGFLTRAKDRARAGDRETAWLLSHIAVLTESRAKLWRSRERWRKRAKRAEGLP
jgi:hypothetical protein